MPSSTVVTGLAGDPGSPTDPRAAHGLRHALTLLAQDKPVAAAHVLAQAHLQDPSSRQLRETLASVQLAGGLLVGARCTFAAMVAVAPRDDFAHYGLGLACARLGDVEQARAELSYAHELRPGEARYAAAAELLSGPAGRDEIDALELGERPVGNRSQRVSGGQP